MSRKRTRDKAAASVKRGEEAQSLKDSPVLNEALTLVEAGGLNLCRTAETPEQAFQGTLRIRAARELRGLIMAFIADGADAVRDLEDSLRAKRRTLDEEEAHASYLTAARRARSEFDNSATATREE